MKPLICVRVAASLLIAVLALSVDAYAQQDDSSPPVTEWVQTGLTQPVLQLFTPSSDAFFARTQTALLRSDDGGSTWRPVQLLEAIAGAVQVDPTNHTIVYVVGQAGIYTSTDDARTWQLILPASTRMPVTCGQDVCRRASSFLA